MHLLTTAWMVTEASMMTHQPDQPGQDDEIIEHAQNRDEVRNEVNRAAQHQGPNVCHHTPLALCKAGGIDMCAL
jgi:hypothetical protein